MKRIKSFQVGSHTISIKYKKNVRNPDSNEEVLGMFIPLRNEIIVSINFKGESLCEEVIEHSLHHEIAHCFMIMMSQWELNSDEVFIDVLGLHMAQYIKSRK